MRVESSTGGAVNLTHNGWMWSICILKKKKKKNYTSCVFGEDSRGRCLWNQFLFTYFQLVNIGHCYFSFHRCSRRSSLFIFTLVNSLILLFGGDRGEKNCSLICGHSKERSPPPSPPAHRSSKSCRRNTSAYFCRLLPGGARLICWSNCVHRTSQCCL